MKYGMLLLWAKRAIRVCWGLAFFFAPLHCRAAASIYSEVRSRKIEIERQLLLPGFAGELSSISALQNGELAVTGAFGTAWVVAISQHGDELWRYTEPRKTGSEQIDQSVFKGAVPLSGDRVLVCAEEKVGRHEAYLTILDKKGTVLDKRAVLPVGDKKFVRSSITGCISWNDGLAVIGMASTGVGGTPFLMKMNARGETLWKKTLEGASAGHPIELVDHSIVLSRLNNLESSLVLVRVDANGELQATRSIKGFYFLSLRSEALSKTVKIISYGSGNHPTLYSLNNRLEDLAPPLAINSFNAEAGTGFSLADDSLALFGRVNSAAIAWMGKSGAVGDVFIFDITKQKSFATTDAIALSGSRFAAAQIVVGPAAENQWLLITWLAFK